MWLKRLLLYEGEEGGTRVPHGLNTIADSIVPIGWRTTVAALVEFTGIFLLPSLLPGPSIKKSTGYLFPCLQGMADALLGMAMTT
jgi:hypothetical protein